jgi:hypothetical protein
VKYDPSVQGSYSGSVVYYRNYIGIPVTSFQVLGNRWNHSKTTVSHTLKKFEEMNFLTACIHYLFHSINDRIKFLSSSDIVA